MMHWRARRGGKEKAASQSRIDLQRGEAARGAHTAPQRPLALPEASSDTHKQQTCPSTSCQIGAKDIASSVLRGAGAAQEVVGCCVIINHKTVLAQTTGTGSLAHARQARPTQARRSAQEEGSMLCSIQRAAPAGAPVIPAA